MNAAVRRFFLKYADFTGRASRSEYWMAEFWLLVLMLPVAALVKVVGESRPGMYVVFGVAAVGLLGTAVPRIAVAVRRLHDVNLSGLLVLVALIPSVGGLIMAVLALVPPNEAGARFDDAERRGRRVLVLPRRGAR